MLESELSVIHELQDAAPNGHVRQDVITTVGDGTKNDEFGRDPMPVKRISDNWHEITNPYIRVVLDAHMLHVDRRADWVDVNGCAGRERHHHPDEQARRDPWLHRHR
jgi:hypothetical protein